MPNTITPTTFDYNNITLSAIADAFSTILPRDKSLLDVQFNVQTTMQKMYSETGDEQIISLPGTRINFSDFLGKYTPACFGNINSEEFSYTDLSMTGVIGFDGGTPTVKPPYEIRGRRFYSLKIRPNYYAYRAFGILDPWIDQAEAWYTCGGVKVNLTNNVVTDITIPSSTLTPIILHIYMKITAKNLFGTITLSSNWVYLVNYDGVSKV